jgi:hypothetical protein
MAARFDRPGFDDLIDFRVYALCGDGCMMEGISSEAASLAALWRLSNLCWIYDNNHVTIEGNTALAFSEDVATRFMGYGWNVTRVADANDLDMLDRAFGSFHEERERPTLIIVDSHIGWGEPHKQDTSAAHGEPLGEEEPRWSGSRAKPRSVRNPPILPACWVRPVRLGSFHQSSDPISSVSLRPWDEWRSRRLEWQSDASMGFIPGHPASRLAVWFRPHHRLCSIETQPSGYARSAGHAGPSSH